MECYVLVVMQSEHQMSVSKFTEIMNLHFNQNISKIVYQLGSYIQSHWGGKVKWM